MARKLTEPVVRYHFVPENHSEALDGVFDYLFNKLLEDQI